jgi:hypothetical protein
MMQFLALNGADVRYFTTITYLHGLTLKLTFLFLLTGFLASYFDIMLAFLVLLCYC